LDIKLQQSVLKIVCESAWYFTNGFNFERAEVDFHFFTQHKSWRILRRSQHRCRDCCWRWKWGEDRNDRLQRGWIWQGQYKNEQINEMWQVFRLLLCDLVNSSRVFRLLAADSMLLWHCDVFCLVHIYFNRTLAERGHNNVIQLFCFKSLLFGFMVFNCFYKETINVWSPRKQVIFVRQIKSECWKEGLHQHVLNNHPWIAILTTILQGETLSTLGFDIKLESYLA